MGDIKVFLLLACSREIQAGGFLEVPGLLGSGCSEADEDEANGDHTVCCNCHWMGRPTLEVSA